MTFPGKAREERLVEDDVARDLDLLRLGVVDLPALIPFLKSNEDALLSMGTESVLPLLLRNMRVSPATKDPESREIGFSAVPDLVRSGVRDRG